MLCGISGLAILRNREQLVGLGGMFLRECFSQDEFKAQHSRWRFITQCKCRQRCTVRIACMPCRAAWQQSRDRFTFSCSQGQSAFLPSFSSPLLHEVVVVWIRPLYYSICYARPPSLSHKKFYCASFAAPSFLLPARSFVVRMNAKNFSPPINNSSKTVNLTRLLAKHGRGNNNVSVSHGHRTLICGES